MFGHCEPRPTRPPYRHGATQTPREENKEERPKPRSKGTTSAAQALPVQTQIVTTVTEVGRSTSFPRPSSPRKSIRLHFPESFARGRWRLECDGGVAAPGGERRPPSGLAWDKLRPRGPGLWGGAVRQLSCLRPPGGNYPPERSQDLLAMGNGPVFGPPYPLSLGEPFSPPSSALSPQRGQGLSLPTSLAMAAPPPSVLEDDHSVPSSPKGNRPYLCWPLWDDHFIPFAPPPGGGKQTAPFHQYQAQSLNYFTEDRPAPHTLGP